MFGIWLASVLLLADAHAAFNSSAAGTTAAEFLNLVVGARAVAIGGAYSAIADDATALYWNPAALTRVKAHSASFMHAAYLGSTHFDYAAYAQKIERGAVGVSIHYLSAGSLTRTDISGNDAGTINPHDLAISLGYAREFSAPPPPFEGSSLGVSVKFIQSTVVTSAKTAAVDFGFLSGALLRDRFRLAFTLTNLGGTMKFDQAEENLPLAMRAGGSYKISERALLGLDVVLPRNDAPFVATGVEYRYPLESIWRLTGRAGYNSETLDDGLGFTGFSFGGGFGRKNINLDYALVTFGALGLAHRVSITLNF